MTDFNKFSQVVHARYNDLAKNEMFVSSMTGDEVWAAYLLAFPAGTNEIFRERTEHDCSCCKNFIRNLGSIVSIQDGLVQTVWDNFADLPHPYNVVSERLSQLLQAELVTGVYRTKEHAYGAEQTLEALGEGQVKRWHHFYGAADRFHDKDAATKASEINSTIAVFQRGLNEIKADAVALVLELIDSNALYRGEEHRATVQGFSDLLAKFWTYDFSARLLYPYEHFTKHGARIRNSSIGQLLLDLSGGMDLEEAVRKFEAMVAPANYKRTTALITPAMIKSALTKLNELGLESAVTRRFAKLSDVSINNVIWANGSAKAMMKGDLASMLMASPQVKPAGKNPEPMTVSIAEFMANVVPDTTDMNLLVSNKFTSNLVSLTAPTDAAAGQLFQWPNQFAWSYNGNITDSITEKVKRAGGGTEGKLRISLAWFNPDDLDLHCKCPDGHVHFGEKKGILDVDMNAWGPSSATEPVENLNWANPKDGKYDIIVHQYHKRSADRPGFVLEVANNGQVSQYSFAGSVSGNTCYISFILKNGVITELQLDKRLVGGGVTQKVWGIDTETFVKVETLMYSPNHWDEKAIGNKHWFFMLEGCKNDQPTRGFYNEFLTPELQKHRKVFEVLGAQTLCPVTADQLSGVGFSSTKADKVTVQVVRKNGDKQLFNVQF